VSRSQKISFSVIIAVTALFLASLPSASASQAKAGATCSKQGLTSGGLICEKQKGRLIWISNIPKNDQISLKLPKNLYVNQGQLKILPIAISGKKILVTSESNSICDISDLSITPIAPGRCVLRTYIAADKKFNTKTQLFTLDVRSSNEFEISIENQYYLDEIGPELTKFSSAGLLIDYNSDTPAICQMRGVKVELLGIGICSISGRQNGNAFVDLSSIKSITFKIIRKNSIVFAPPESLLLAATTYQLIASSTSGLGITFTSTTPEICINSSSVLTLLKHGYCLIEASQPGDDFTVPASVVTARIKVMRENAITFKTPIDVTLKLKSLQLTAISTAGLPVTYKSLTPNTCTISNNSASLLGVGSCTIVASQSGDEFTPPAQDVSNSFSISNDRVLADQPDIFTGYQVKAIYVVPSDGTDRSYDTNGYLASILREGNSLLKTSLGLEYQIDSVGTDFDIQFFRSSYSQTYFLTAGNLNADLAREMKLYESPSLDRKNYIFFVDVPDLKGKLACGYASMPGLLAVVAIGPSIPGSTSTCVGKSLQVENYTSTAWVHESFHNLGVDHTLNDSCDLMRTSGTCNSSWTIDKEKTRYVSTSIQGVDILTLRVWKGYTSDQTLRASCTLQSSQIPRSDGLKYAICPIGSQIIGALTYCWSSITSVELQVWKNNSWESLGEGKNYSEPWGKYVNWKCSNSTAPWKEVTVNSPGIQKYRWMINGREGEVFNIIWQR